MEEVVASLKESINNLMKITDVASIFVDNKGRISVVTNDENIFDGRIVCVDKKNYNALPYRKHTIIDGVEFVTWVKDVED